MKWLSVFFTLTIFTIATGQVDSLKYALSKELDTDKRIELLTQLAYSYLKDDVAESGRYAEEALALSSNTSNLQSIAAAQNSVANFYARSGKFDQAKADSLYFLALNNALELGDTSMLETIYNNLGIQSESRGDREEALEWYQKSLRFDPDTLDPSSYSRTLRNVGVVYDLLEQFPQAEEYFLDAVYTAKKGNDQFEEAEALNSLAITISKQGNLRKGLSIFKQALKLYQNQGKTETTVNALNNICYSYQLLNELDSALFYMESIDSQLQKSEEAGLKMRVMVTKSEILGKQERINEAIGTLEEALKIAPTSGDLHHYMGIYKNLSNLYGKKNDFQKALMYTSRYHTFKDSVNQVKALEKMNELQVKYETAEKDRLIERQELMLTKSSHQQNLLILLSLVLGAASIAIVVWYRQRLRARQKIEEQRKLIQQQKIDALEKQHRMITMTGMIKGQEEERHRIAQDLHDGLGGLMSTIKSHFQSLRPQYESSEIAIKTNALIDQACQEVSRVSHDLMPTALTQEGLADAIIDLAATIKQAHGINLEVNIEGLDERLEETEEKVIFRLIQELTTNMVKHAVAQQGLIQIVKKENQLLILVEDDGKGFDYQKAKMNGGIGLKGIQSRVDYLGGQLSVDSVLDEGTTTTIQLKLQE